MPETDRPHARKRPAVSEIPVWQQVKPYEDIRFEAAEGIAKVTINRPEVRNAFRPTTLHELARAFRDGADDAAPWAQPQPSLAEGAVVPRPARAIELLEAVHTTGGAAVAVDESSIERALRLLWSAGLRVEPTAALPVAFLLGGAAPVILNGAGPVVVLLSGAGLRQGRPLVALPCLPS